MDMGRPNLANQPPNPFPKSSVIGKTTNQPKDQTSYVHIPLAIYFYLLNHSRSSY